MPRRSKGPRLWLRPAWRDGNSFRPAVWIIRDAGRQISTGCSERDDRQAQDRLARYILEKHEPPRRERDLAAIPVADVISIYLRDVVPGQARPEKAIERAERLNAFFGDKTLAEITGAACRAYAAARAGQGRSNKGTGGGARRDLQDLAAAINHHAKEGFHRGLVRVALPPKGEARQRWLTRDEFKRLLKVCWTTREMQDGKPTERRPLLHLYRFLILGVYTGSRPGAILNASWMRGPRLSWIDTANGVFHRHADGAAVTNKRQPTVKLTAKVLRLCRRWERLDAAKAPPQVYLVEFAGQPVDSVKTALARACKLAKLPAGVTAYTLRHTCASWLVADGLPTRLVADFLGTSEAMILQHYGHLAPGYQQEAAEAIGRKR
ncbi:MAG: site-specific integrase [Rhodomicrobium sp.]